MKTALHVPWVDTALRAIEVLTIPDPATMIQARISLRPMTASRMLTKDKRPVQDLTPDSSKHHMPGVVYAVHGRMVDLEILDLESRPGSDHRDCEETYDTGYHTERVEH